MKTTFAVCAAAAILALVSGDEAFEPRFALSYMRICRIQVPSVGADIAIRVGIIRHVFPQKRIVAKLAFLALLIIDWLDVCFLAQVRQIGVILFAFISRVRHNRSVTLA